MDYQTLFAARSPQSLNPRFRCQRFPRFHLSWKPHQRDIVKWAVRGGCRAILPFGLGKSVMQIETLRLIHAHAGGKVLVICPLGVRQEFKRDAQMLMRSEFRVCRESEMTPYGFRP